MIMMGTIGLGAIPLLATFCRFLGRSPCKILLTFSVELVILLSQGLKTNGMLIAAKWQSIHTK